MTTPSTSPETELPTLTEKHIEALLNEGKGEAHMKLFREGMSVVSALSSRTHGIYDTRTQRVVSIADLERLRSFAPYSCLPTIDGWLSSTPADTENP